MVVIDGLPDSMVQRLVLVDARGPWEHKLKTWPGLVGVDSFTGSVLYRSILALGL